MKVALAGIVKNEFPYLLEWIAHHKNIGIDHFIIANHGSTDGTTELLEAFQKLGFLTTFYISAETEAPQLPAYKKILEDYGNGYDWIGFMDVDEFFVIEEKTSLKQILSEQGENIGGITFNWAVYGSSFQKHPDNFDLPSPVTSRFTWRARKESEINNHTKCFVKPKAVALDKLILYSNPHKFSLNNDLHYINSKLDRLTNRQEITWKNARINHYVIKSNWEFANKKMPKGRVAWGNSVHRDWLFFQTHDLNEVFESFSHNLAQLRDETMVQLKKELHTVGYKYPEKKQAKVEENELFFKEFETIEIANNEMVIKGWVIDTNGKSPIADIDFLLKSSSLQVRPSRLIISKSKKAKEKNANASLRSGFEVYFSLDKLEKVKSLSLIVYHERKELKMIDVDLGKLKQKTKLTFLQKLKKVIWN